MKPFIRLSLIASLLGFTACPDLQQFLTQGNGILTLIIPSSVLISQSFQVAARISNATAIQWSVRDETGLTLSPFPCSSDQGPVQTCIFDMAGEMKFEVTAHFPNGTIAVASATMDIIDPTAPQNQAPKLLLDIKDGASTLVATVATFRAHEFGRTVFPEDVSYSWSFARSIDDTTPTSQLKFELSIDEGAYEQLSLSSSRTFSNPGLYPAKIRVTDLDGNYSIKTFTIFVSCVAPPLVVSPAQVQISPEAIFGHFTYNAAGAVSGGAPPYKYRWDYNGDGVWDQYDPSDPDHAEEWTSLATVSQYTIYGGQRNVQLAVLDACNQLQIVEIPNYFAIPHTEGTNRNTIPDGDPDHAQGPQLGNQLFLHANMVALNGNTDRAIVNADLVSIQPPGDIGDKRVVCSAYESAGKVNLTVHGKHRYDKRGVFYHRQHGMTINITDTMSPTNRKIQSFTVDTDDGPDGQEFTTYSVPQGASCNLTRMEVTVLPGGAGTCSDGSAQGMHTYLFDYTFDCPLLEDFRNHRRARAEVGSGYCEFSIIDECPPGGGGGGGGNPPPAE